MIASMVVDRNAAGTTDGVHLSSLPIRPLVERHMILPRYQWSFRQICRSPHTETTTSLPFVGMASIAAYGRDYGAEHTHLGLRTVRNCLPVANHVNALPQSNSPKGQLLLSTPSPAAQVLSAPPLAVRLLRSAPAA